MFVPVPFWFWMLHGGGCPSSLLAFPSLQPVTCFGGVLCHWGRRASASVCGGPAVQGSCRCVSCCLLWLFSLL